MGKKTVVWLGLLCAMGTSACGPPLADKPGRLETIRFGDDALHLEYSLPVKQCRDKSTPLVLFLSPGLHFRHQRIVNGRTNNFFTVFDQYLNNAGFSLGRFRFRNTRPLDVEQSLHRVRRFLEWNRRNKRFSPVYLLSLGSAARLALRLLTRPGVVAALLVSPHRSGYRQVLEWRLLEGPGEHFLLCFDGNGDGRVTQAEYDADPYGDRHRRYKGKQLADYDHDGDGVVDAGDFRSLGRPRLRSLLRALETGDEETTQQLLGKEESSVWLRQLCAAGGLLPLFQTAPKPVLILHGTEDLRISVRESRGLPTLLSNTNRVRIRIFPVHDHELNWRRYAERGSLSNGLLALFKAFFAWQDARPVHTP